MCFPNCITKRSNPRSSSFSSSCGGLLRQLACEGWMFRRSTVVGADKGGDKRWWWPNCSCSLVTAAKSPTEHFTIPILVSMLHKGRRSTDFKSLGLRNVRSGLQQARINQGFRDANPDLFCLDSSSEAKLFWLICSVWNDSFWINGFGDILKLPRCYCSPHDFLSKIVSVPYYLPKEEKTM